MGCYSLALAHVHSLKQTPIHCSYSSLTICPIDSSSGVVNGTHLSQWCSCKQPLWLRSDTIHKTMSPFKVILVSHRMCAVEFQRAYSNVTTGPAHCKVPTVEWVGTPVHSTFLHHKRCHISSAFLSCVSTEVQCGRGLLQWGSAIV